MTSGDLAALLETLGCPPDQAPTMAGQLEKRARQLAQKTGKSYEAAVTHLLNLMKQGWAAKEKGF